MTYCIDQNVLNIASHNALLNFYFYLMDISHKNSFLFIILTEC